MQVNSPARPECPRGVATLLRIVVPAEAGLLVLLLVLIFLVEGKAVVPFDLQVTHEIQEETRPVISAVLTAVSDLGNMPVVAVLTFAAAAGVLLWRRWLEAAFILATASNLLVSAAAKSIVGRPRPFTDLAPGSLVSLHGDSFPSGHVVFFMSFLGFLAYLAWRHLTSLARWVAIGACGLLIVLVGPSRVYLGAHWASDVLGGYVVGAMLLLVLVTLYENAVCRTYKERTQRD